MALLLLLVLLMLLLFVVRSCRPVTAAGADANVAAAAAAGVLNESLGAKLRWMLTWGTSTGRLPRLRGTGQDKQYKRYMVIVRGTAPAGTYTAGN